MFAFRVNRKKLDRDPLRPLYGRIIAWKLKEIHGVSFAFLFRGVDLFAELRTWRGN